MAHIAKGKTDFAPYPKSSQFPQKTVETFRPPSQIKGELESQFREPRKPSGNLLHALLRLDKDAQQKRDTDAHTQISLLAETLASEGWVKSGHGPSFEGQVLRGYRLPLKRGTQPEEIKDHFIQLAREMSIKLPGWQPIVMPISSDGGIGIGLYRVGWQQAEFIALQLQSYFPHESVDALKLRWAIVPREGILYEFPAPSQKELDQVLPSIEESFVDYLQYQKSEGEAAGYLFMHTAFPSKLLLAFRLP